MNLLPQLLCPLIVRPINTIKLRCCQYDLYILRNFVSQNLKNIVLFFVSCFPQHYKHFNLTRCGILDIYILLCYNCIWKSLHKQRINRIMINTDSQAKLLAYQMTKKYFADNPEKLMAILQDAKVDLNPHQVGAALFAFKSPFSRGAILADEVGLGKTIEAGLVLSQNWAERKRKLLIIAPASLRKQWNAELAEKFYLPSVILESKSFNKEINQGNLNPFDQNYIVITSYNFAKSKMPYVKAVNWDLIVIDEAHRLRNAYRSDNKTARSLKENLSQYKKLLLTATPLQNSLLELYSLISFIDENIFGDMTSFKHNYIHGEMTAADFEDLRHRISPLVYRTLRKQVLEYISYTNRIPITQSFEPNKDEQELYNKISNYLMRDSLNALPNSQRQLITLIMRKLMASSTFAITDTIRSLITRLERYYNKLNKKPVATVLPLMDEDVEDIYLEDEEDDDDDETQKDFDSDYDGIIIDEATRKEKSESILKEIEELKGYLALAESINKNAKGESLLVALHKGFEKLHELGANEKAVIFTESRRTQDYVKTLLEKEGLNVVLFNGSNSDEKSKSIYNEWLKANKNTGKITGSMTADKRAALVDYFRDTADIMIATEAAAEGINLQFCSLVVNYDLPWNPQRIEQRIGRCHRYGQKYDVVVINFLNNKNLADKRVFELLSEKFKLFEGVFGSSDEVLGSIESGVDFEKKINEIYQTCRTQEEINRAFDELKASLNDSIESKMEQTRKQLLENFDEEVNEKLRVNLRSSKEYLDRYSQNLWDLTEYVLRDKATFDFDRLYFSVTGMPEMNGQYSFKPAHEFEVYRAEHPLAKKVFEEAKDYNAENVSLTFDLSGYAGNISVLNDYKGKSGTLAVYDMEIGSIEDENYVLFAGITDDGEELPDEVMERMFHLPATQEPCEPLKDEIFLPIIEAKQQAIFENIEERNSKFFDEEMDKLERWCKDLKDSLESKLRQMDIDLKTMRTEVRKITRLADKLQKQREIKDLESKRNKLRFNLYEEQDKIEQQKNELIDKVSERLKQQVTCERILMIKWRIV